MRRFWDSVVRPVLDVVQPSLMVEIGAAGGKNTKHLAAYCREHGVVLHVIDPAPMFEVEEIRQYGDFVMHEDLSLNVLRDLQPVDVALIDGDHNWYTVFNELKLLHSSAEKAGRHAPVVCCHDACWPYARRDLYYDPSTIPDEFMQPWGRGGIIEGQSELAPDAGTNRGACHALHEGGPRNGVMTAIEDLVAEAGESISVSVIPRYYGLAVLVPRSRAEAHPGLEEIVSRSLAEPQRSKPSKPRKTETHEPDQALAERNAAARDEREPHA